MMFSWLNALTVQQETIMIIQEQIIEEIKQIPNDKLEEIYDLIHYFRLGVTQEKQSQNINVKQRWPPMTWTVNQES